MSTPGFDKIVAFTDIHWGARGGAETHTADCNNFTEWMIQRGKEFGATTCVFLGDWHHDRSKIGVNTLNHSVNAMRRIAENFDHTYVIMGNHDLFYRDKRDIASACFGELIDKLTIVQHPLVIGDTRFQPWMVGDDWKDVENWQERYVFGHFEIPGFMMNALVECPDHGTISKTHFKNQEYVFSGHFHKRQRSGNIHYVGNAFPHNYSDAWDFERGCMLFQHGSSPLYVDWADAPRYVTGTLTGLVESPGSYLNKNTYARISINADFSYEEIAAIQQELCGQYAVRELELIPENPHETMNVDAVDVGFKTIDQMVIEGLMAVESSVIDNKLLIELYESL